ncbi:MAG: fibronectin type III domain-containing protein [Parcubacteria group bacterium LiPW_41]|nr:MAG: fibronectin type III domain-containing protein [Parcubacteria group bacterium LiPW_41]
MKKLLYIVSFFILSFSLFAQGLEFGKTSVPFGDLGVGKQNIERVPIQNTTQESIEITGFEYIIQTDGLLPHHMISSIDFYDGTTQLASARVLESSMQSVFISGGRFYLDVSFVLAPQTEKEILVNGEVSGTGLVKLVLTKVYGVGKSKRFYFATGDEKNFPWRKTALKESVAMSAVVKERVVAPGSKRFRIPLEINSGSQYRSVDLNMIHYGDQLGKTKIVFHEGYSFEWWDERFSGWSGDLKMNSRVDASRFIVLGQNYVKGPVIFNLYAGVSSELKGGDSVPIMFGPALYNDSEVIRCVESSIIIGPAVIFGDANNNNSHEVTPGDITTALDLMYGVVADDDQLLKKKLAADVNGSGEPDDDDIYHLLQMVFDPSYVPPVLRDPQSPTVCGNTVSTQPTLIVKKNGQKTDFYLSGENITSASIRIPIGLTVEKGSALKDIFSVREKSGKQLLIFANKKAIDISKPIFSIQDNGKSVEISGSVNGGVPIETQKVTDVSDNSKLPTKYSLSQNYPNPFNPTTTIAFTVPMSTRIELSVFDMLGREIAVLVNEEKPAGEYSVKFDASTYASGIYFYKLKTDNNLITKKMLLLK